MEINHSKIKESNRKRIIKLLLEKNEITKLDISRDLDISVTTVSTNINELKDLHVVEDVRSLESTGGRKAISIKIDENCRYSIGIALTTHHIKISVVNLKGEVVGQVRQRHNHKGLDNIILLIKSYLEEIVKKFKLTPDNLLGIAFSIPGLVDSEKGIIKNCYFLGVSNYNLKEKFAYMNVPVYVDNEANLSAFYEFLNKNDDTGSLLYVSITEGLGLGIVVDGKIYRGTNNSAGEMGHMKIVVDGKQCKCGSRGCIEAYVSKDSIIEEYNHLASTDIDDISEFEEICTSDDEHATKVMDDYLKLLAAGISNLIMILDPSTIIIGGDINTLLAPYIEKLKKIIYDNSLYIDERNCMIKVADFKESYLLGAAMMPIEEFLEVK